MLELLGFRLGRPVAAILALALVAGGVAGFVAWERRAATLALQRAVAQAREDARAACEARWRADVERSNARAEREKAAQIEAAARRQAEADAAIGDLKRALDEMELKNAAVPDGDRCGLERGRVRLLPR